MKLTKLFQLLVVGGALTGGATGCGPEDVPTGDNGSNKSAAGGGAQALNDGGTGGGTGGGSAAGGGVGSGGGTSGAGGGVSFW